MLEMAVEGYSYLKEGSLEGGRYEVSEVVEV